MVEWKQHLVNELPVSAVQEGISRVGIYLNVRGDKTV